MSKDKDKCEFWDIKKLEQNEIQQKKLGMCEVVWGKYRRGRWGGGKEGEDSIIFARLVQFVTPAVVFSQPPRAARTDNSLIIAPFLALCPCGQLQQMGVLSRDPQPPPPPGPPSWGPRATCLRKDAHTVCMTHKSLVNKHVFSVLFRKWVKDSRGRSMCWCVHLGVVKCYCGFMVLVLCKQQPVICTLFVLGFASQATKMLLQYSNLWLVEVKSAASEEFCKLKAVKTLKKNPLNKTTVNSSRC